MARSRRFFAAVIACLAIPSLATAALKDVGPVTGYGPGTTYGFPLWYRDTSGTAVTLCQEQRPSPNASAGGAPMCFPLPNDPAGYQTPFPNIGGEIFYFDATNTITGNGFSMLWAGALEATYSAGTPTVGQEITFTRIRVTMDTTVAGTYTVTHPYGQEVFPGVKGGKRAVFFTVDVGVAPGVFTGALAGGVGPFLEWDTNVTTPTAPFGFDPASGLAYSLQLANPDGTFTQFAGDPNFTHTVTGSPFLQNFVRVDGPPGSNLDGAGNDFIISYQFNVLGQKYTTPIPQPLTVYRSEWGVNSAGTMQWVNVFADTIPSAKLIATAPNMPTQEMVVDTLTGEAFSAAYFGVDTANPVGTSVSVTNLNDNPHSTATGPLADNVAIRKAYFTPNIAGDYRSGGIISAEVETSVQWDPRINPATGLPFGAPPTLSILELPGAVSTPAVGGAGPWVQTISGTLLAGVVPPWRLTAQSPLGGSASMPLIFDPGLLPAAPTPTPGVVALDIAVTTPSGSAIGVPLTADSAAVVTILAPPANGTVAVSAAVAPATGWVATYTPKPLFFGTDTFTYVLADTALPVPHYSNKGTVTATVTAVNHAPVAVGDGANTTAGVPVVINVAANDTDVDPAGTPAGTINPASVVITTPPTRGTVVNNLNGTVTYTPNVGVVGVTDSFQYTIADSAVPPAVSTPGTVSVIIAGTETLTVTRAEWTVSKQRYRVVGTSNIFGPLIANKVTVYGCAVSATSIATCPAGSVVNIGTTTIDALGNWLLDIPNPVTIFCNATTKLCPAQERSTGGGVANVSIAQK